MSFDIDLDWPAGDRSQGIADVRMAVGRSVFTRLLDEHEGSRRDYFRASPLLLGFWFVDNFWRLRWEPLDDPHFPSTEWRLRHELSAASGDTVLPPFMIYGMGPRVMVAPVNGVEDDGSAIRYLQERPLTMLSDEFEAGLERFFGTLLRCHDLPDSAAFADLVGQLARERADDELAAWRRLEACLGYDPDQAPEAIVEALLSFEERVGEAAIDEAALATKGAAAPIALEAVLEAVEASDVVVDFASVQGQVDPAALPGQTPWQAAEDAAIALRAALNLGNTVRWADLGDILRVRWELLKEATATARHLPFAAKSQDCGTKSQLALAMKPLNDRRFELARMIGDEVWTGGLGFGVISRSRTDRQKFQRAFAQALLCPMEALRDVVDVNRPTREQIVQAASRFGVRDKVIITILRNRGYLPRESMADWLEAA